MPKVKLRTETIALLRFGHNKRRPHARGSDRRGQIPNMTSIDQRPDDIAERTAVALKFDQPAVGWALTQP